MSERFRNANIETQRRSGINGRNRIMRIIIYLHDLVVVDLVSVVVDFTRNVLKVR